jgi:anaerobic magnesium-protoporphyrin IX monomethyl ester cyclase
MKVLFIYPNMYSALSFSPAIAQLSAVLKRAGHDVALIHLHSRVGFGFDPDQSSDWGKLGHKVQAIKPDLIGITSTSFEYDVTNRMARFLGRQSAPIILGGAHATYCPDDIWNSAFDAFCVGDGEMPLIELCRRLEENVPRDALFRDLPSFLSKESSSSGLPDPIPLFDQVENLDDLPRMDRDLFDMEQIIRARAGWVDVYTARGCPFPCTYCCNHVFERLYAKSKKKPRGYRQRSVGNVLNEITYLLEKYPGKVKVISFQEDYLNLDRKWMLDFCKDYQQAVGLPFYMCARPNSIDPEVAAALKGAGCREVSLGIETGSEFIRNTILKKSISNGHIRHAAQCLKREKIRIFANIMLGAPQETNETLGETVAMLAEIKPELIRPTIVVPLRGTELHDNCVRNGLLSISNFTPSKSLFEESVLRLSDLSPLELQRFRYLFGWKVNAAMRDGLYGIYSPCIQAMEREPLEKWRERGFLRDVIQRDADLSYVSQKLGLPHYRFFGEASELEELGHVKRYELCEPAYRDSEQMQERMLA